MTDQSDNQTLDLFDRILHEQARPVAGSRPTQPAPDTDSPVAAAPAATTSTPAADEEGGAVAVLETEEGGGGDRGSMDDDIPLMPDGRTPVADYIERAYLAYAMSVVTGRALPRVDDGQKPVQRRILYAMKRMGLDDKTKHVKSARVVGDVIGKLHPHGDSSVYDAMVRMAQNFTLRYPLVDGQGNFGSRDGDSAAAMRYTEARLTPYADLLLAEIDQGTVDFIPNYDQQFEEPATLPARLPILLLNGASGIAVGMATEIPSHNLTEVAEACKLVIRKPQATLEDVLAIMPGPDFAGGAQVISAPEDIFKAYTTGRGSVRLRARWTMEQLARGQWQIVINELPQGISTQTVLAEIEALTNPQVKANKKTLTPEQLNLKALVLSVLDTVRDDSDKANPVRIILEPKTSKVSPDELMAVLLAHTSLEVNSSINLVSLGRNGRPAQKGLLEILQEWVDFRYVTVTRRTQYRLDQVTHRIHILDGRMIAFLNIEEVIRVIRESDDPKANLMAKFQLSEIQADDILEIRLRQLARLEGIKIERELADLRVEAEGLRHLLADREAMTNLIVTEIEADQKKFGDKRRTLIEAAVKVTLSDVAPASDDPVTIVVSKNGWFRARAGHGVDISNIGFKVGDSLLCAFETRTSQTLAVFDTNGRCYNIPASQVPNGRGDGAPLTSLIDIQAGGRIFYVMPLVLDADYLVANSSGYGYVCKGGDLATRQRAGKAFMTLEPSDTMLPPVKVAGDTVAAVCSGSRMLLFPLSEVKVMPKGKGVILMDLGAKEELTGIAVTDGQVIDILAGEKVISLSGADLEKYRLHRARKGCQIPGKAKPSGVQQGKPGA